MKSIYTAMIVDDEQHCIRSLCTKLSWTGLPIQVSATANTLQEASAFLKDSSPDFLFLDVKMPDGRGFDLLKKYRSDHTQVIMCTAFENFALEAFQHLAVGYLLKPVQTEELSTLLKSLIQRNKVKNKLQLERGPSGHFTEISEAMYIKSDGSYSQVIFEDGATSTLSKRLKILENSLSPNFVRIHHQYLLNMNFVKQLKLTHPAHAELKNGIKLPISREKRKSLLPINLSDE